MRQKIKKRRDIVTRLCADAVLWQSDLADLMGITGNTVARWKSGKLRCSAMAQAFLALLWKLHQGGIDLSRLDEPRLHTRCGYRMPEAWFE